MLLILGCYVPTTVGLRTDGVLAAAGRGEVGAVAGEMLNDLGGEDWPLGPGFGLTGHYTLVDGVAVSGSIARYDALSGAEGEVRVRAADEDKGGVLTIAVLAGGGLVWGETGSPVWGTHLGVVAGHDVGANLRPFVGARVNPVLAGDPLVARLFADGGAGVSWRPPLGEGLSGLVLVEGDWIHGIDAVYTPADDHVTFGDDVPVNAADVNAYVLMLTLGLTWRE
jgi:hypothetical protein